MFIGKVRQNGELGESSFFEIDSKEEIESLSIILRRELFVKGLYFKDLLNLIYFEQLSFSIVKRHSFYGLVSKRVEEIIHLLMSTTSVRELL